jgi:hypothetical protein
MKTGLVRLYPRRWRDRYGEEFEALLEQQSATVGAAADIILGAVDAHLTANAPEQRGSWLRRIPELMIVLGGLVWLAAGWANMAAHSRPDLQNLSAQFVWLGVLIVAIGTLLEPTFRSRPGFLRVASTVPAANLLILASVGQLCLSWPSVAANIWSVLSVLVVGSVVVQLAWAASMIARLPQLRLALLVLGGGVLLNLTVGQVVRSGPDYPPIQDQILASLLPFAWTLIGVSAIWSRRPHAAALL